MLLLQFFVYSYLILEIRISFFCSIWKSTKLPSLVVFWIYSECILSAKKRETSTIIQMAYQSICYISVHSITTTPLTSLTPPTLTLTYTSFTLTTFPIFKSIPQFPLLPLLHYYHLSPYFLITTSCLTFLLVLWLSLTNLPFLLVLWLSLTNLPLPYCTVL